MHILCQILRNTVVDENTGIDRVLDKTRTITGAEATVGHMNSSPPPRGMLWKLQCFIQSCLAFPMAFLPYVL